MREIVGLDMQHAGLSNELRSSLLGGLLYGERGLTVHRDASYYENTRLKRVPAEVIGGLAHTTMLREIGHELMRVPQAIFTLNRASSGSRSSWRSAATSAATFRSSPTATRRR
jgi:hypothetical protein